MNAMADVKQPSKAWPLIKAVAKAVPSFGILGGLADLQDELTAEEAQKKSLPALDAFFENFDALLAAVQRLDGTITGGVLEDAAVELAEDLYLGATARKYLYSDFKGIEQMEKLVPLELDDVFVNLRLRREGWDRGEREDAFLERLHDADGQAEERLAELDVLRLRSRPLGSGTRGGAPETVDQILASNGAAVLLGGPGSGKTTRPFFRWRAPCQRTASYISIRLSEPPAKNTSSALCRRAVTYRSSWMHRAPLSSSATTENTRCGRWRPDLVFQSQTARWLHWMDRRTAFPAT